MPIRFGIADSSELGRRTVITVTGELDAVTASDLGDYLDQAFETDGRIVLDLTGVTGVYDGTLSSLAMRGRDRAAALDTAEEVSRRAARRPRRSSAA